MFVQEILVSTLLACACLQVVSTDDDPGDASNSDGLTKLTLSSMKGMTNVLNSGAGAAAEGVDLTSTAMANGLQTLGGTAALANNAQKMKFDALKHTRTAAGRFGQVLTNLGSGAIAGALNRGAAAIDASRKATEFILTEADKVGGAGKRVAKSVVSNTSGTTVNALNGIDKMVTATGAVREEVADGASAIHDAGTEVVKEGVKTWKDVSLAQLNNFRADMEKARKSAIEQSGKPAKTTEKPRDPLIPEKSSGTKVEDKVNASTKTEEKNSVWGNWW